MTTEECAPDVHRLLTLMVNVYFVEDGAGGWTLVDAGLRGYAGAIRRAARRLFGSTPPSAIVLTHGHFDHVGTLPHLVGAWRVPVYAHPLEMPYLTGRSSYPPPDPTVGGGVWSVLSPMFARFSLHLGGRVRMLPADGHVPTLPPWRWVHTSGHRPGHVSLFRESDRTLLAGDAFVTTRQESLIDVMTQRAIMWRPPAYFTSDWTAERHSVQRLSDLEPELAATGHGTPLRGQRMCAALEGLAVEFDDVMPERGRYVDQPAVADERGVTYVPARTGPHPAAVAIGAAALAAGIGFALASRRGRVAR